MGTERRRKVVFFLHYLAALGVGAVWSHLPYVRERAGDENVSRFLWLCATVPAYLAARAYISLTRPVPEWLDWSFLTVDLFVITAATRWSGGLRSEAGLMYFWPLATCAISRMPNRTIFTGMASGGLYVLASQPDAGYTPEAHWGILLARIAIVLMATSVAYSFAKGERALVSEVTRLRERAAVEDYRSELAREMHDGVQQNIARAVARLEVAARVPPEEGLPIALGERQTLRNAADEIRYLVRRMRPERFGRQSLQEALRLHTSSFESRTGIECEFSLDGPEPELAPRVEHSIFRIVQEALTNVEKHSGTDSVSVSLWTSPDAVTATVADNGCGFDTDVETSGFGRASMAERAAKLAGQLSITSETGEGTTVTLSIPMRHEEASHVDTSDDSG